jgi:hypothetical protein
LTRCLREGSQFKKELKRMSMDKAKVRDALLSICTNITPWTPSQGPPARFWSRDKISVSLNDNEELKFAEVIREILKNEFIFENFAVREIEEKVENIVSRTLQLALIERRANIDLEINNLSTSLGGEIKEYQFVVPLSNMNIPKSLKIGDVEFKIFSQYQAGKWVKMFRDIIKDNPNYDEIQKKEMIDSIRERSVEPLKNNICAETIVKAGIERAHEIAYRKIAEAIDIVKLYCLVEIGLNGINIGLKGEILGSDVRSILTRSISDGTLDPTLERVGPLYSLDIDDKLLKMMKNSGLQKINKVLLKNEKTWVERRILRAIYWYSRIFDTPARRTDERKILIRREISKDKKEEIVEYGFLGEQLLKTMVALESLLIIRGEPVQNNIAERAAYILGTNYDSRRRVKKFIKDMYKLRSDVVHGRFTYISISELKYLISIARLAIIALVLKKDRFGLKTQRDFYEWFEKRKLS